MAKYKVTHRVLSWEDDEVTDSYSVEMLFGELHRQYPLWPSTFSNCKCQRQIARGGGRCALCYEEDLAKLIGEDAAKDIHTTIKYLQALKIAALESVK